MFNVENKTTQITEAVAVETVVRCTEIDVNGHLNNAKFVEYLEWGREEWYESHGFGYDHLEELRVITESCWRQSTPQLVTQCAVGVFRGAPHRRLRPVFRAGWVPRTCAV